MSIQASICQTLGEVHEIQSTKRVYLWSGVRRTKIQTTTRPDYVWPEVWTKIGKAAQNGEEQEWAKEKEKLDNARKLRGIYFIDPDDKEYSEIIKSAGRKLERPVAPAIPCKRHKQHPSIVKENVEQKKWP